MYPIIEKSLLFMRSDDPLMDLTPRERVVLHFTAKDLGCQQIATQMSISPATMKVHRKNIIRKLGLCGKVAFRQAIRSLERDGRLPPYDGLPPN